MSEMAMWTGDKNLLNIFFGYSKEGSYCRRYLDAAIPDIK